MCTAFVGPGRSSWERSPCRLKPSIMRGWRGAHWSVTSFRATSIWPRPPRLQTAALMAACNAPDLERLDAARTSFKDALIAWGRIEHVRFGPIAEQNRYDAMIFWPDPRGIARRQIARVLAQQEADALLPQVLAGKSVAIQGFSALDVVLFGSGSEIIARPETAGRFRCGYARALAVNIETVARETLAGWSDPAGFARLWLNPAAGNPAFLNAKETTHALVQAYLTGLKQVRNVRLGGPLGLRGVALARWSLLFPTATWRSSWSLPMSKDCVLCSSSRVSRRLHRRVLRPAASCNRLPQISSWQSQGCARSLVSEPIRFKTAQHAVNSSHSGFRSRTRTMRPSQPCPRRPACP